MTEHLTEIDLAQIERENRDHGERIRRGRDVIEYYSAQEEGYDFLPEDFRAAAVDAITDMLHALAGADLDPEAAHAMAWRHFMAERAER